MAKRKSPQPRLSADIARNLGFVILVLISCLSLVWGCSAYVHRSDLFTVKDVVVSEGLGTLDIPELAKLRGRNIFRVDLDRFEVRLHSKYPTLSNLRVMRRFPDQILVTAIKREPFARAQFQGHVLLIDREGYLLGAPREGDERLPVVKGLRSSRLASGTVVDDPRFDVAAGIITVFQEKRAVAELPLRSVDVADTVRIVCLTGEEAGGEGIEVIVDAQSFTSHIGELGMLLDHHDLDLAEVKYVDLRFGAPIIGQKKTAAKK